MKRQKFKLRVPIDSSGGELFPALMVNPLKPIGLTLTTRSGLFLLHG
jgi:hypothetical protein